MEVNYIITLSYSIYAVSSRNNIHTYTQHLINAKLLNDSNNLLIMKFYTNEETPKEHDYRQWTLSRGLQGIWMSLKLT